MRINNQRKPDCQRVDTSILLNVKHHVENIVIAETCRLSILGYIRVRQSNIERGMHNKHKVLIVHDLDALSTS